MADTRRLFFSVALMVFFSAGCETNHKVRHFNTKPTARIVGLKFQDVQLDYATLLFEIEVDNPDYRLIHSLLLPVKHL